MNKVLIFGGNGFVGKYLAQEFKEYGYSVYVSDYNVCRTELKEYIDDYYQLDILNAEMVCEVIKKTKPVFIVNLAAISSVGESWKIPTKTIAVNVNGSINILEAVKTQKLDAKILLVGSSEEYEISSDKIAETYTINANNPYGISKVTQEKISALYREEYGLKIINTRTFNHTGIGHAINFAIPSFINQVAQIHKSGKPGQIKVGNLSAIRDLGDVRDMARAYRMILEGDSQSVVFNVGSGRCYSLDEILKYIISLTNQKVEIIVDTEKLRPLDNPIIWCDNTLIKNEIGWEPNYTVFDAINEMFNFSINH